MAIRLFLLNNILAGLTMSALYWLAFVRHKHFSYEMSHKEKLAFASKTIFTTFFFIIFLGTTFIKISENYFFAVIIGLALIRKGYLRYFMKQGGNAD